MDGLENGEECLLATSCSYGQTIFLIKLLWKNWQLQNNIKSSAVGMGEMHSNVEITFSRTFKNTTQFKYTQGYWN